MLVEAQDQHHCLESSNVSLRLVAWLGRLFAEERQRVEVQAQLLCGAFRWRQGLARGLHRRCDCVLRAVEALRGRLKALWAVAVVRCESTRTVRPGAVTEARAQASGGPLLPISELRHHGQHSRSAAKACAGSI
jgi:hypothetical protein